MQPNAHVGHLNIILNLYLSLSPVVEDVERGTVAVESKLQCDALTERPSQPSRPTLTTYILDNFHTSHSFAMADTNQYGRHDNPQDIHEIVDA